MADDDLSKRANDLIFKPQATERRKAAERRTGSRMRGPERRRASVGDKLTKDVSHLEGTLKNTPKVPITQSLPAPDRTAKYFTGGGGKFVDHTPESIISHIGAGDAAKKYLSKAASAPGRLRSMAKGAVGAIKSGAHSIGRSADLISTAGLLGNAVISIAKAKHEEREAKLGTKMIKSGMKYRKLNKALGTNREGIPEIKVK